MKILIVEDEFKIARAIKNGFKQEGWVSDIADDGPTGLLLATTEQYDAIILDRMLPGGLDGIEICRQLREKVVKTPILILTARGQVRDKVAGLNAGADDYLVKPFAFNELVARVKALLRRPAELSGTILEIDGLKMHTVNHQVSRDGQIIDLSQKEYALLEYLLSNRGVVLSKTNIIDHVWDFDDDILPNTVEVFIKNLRAKIDKPFKSHPKIIETVRGFGYRIGENL